MSEKRKNNVNGVSGIRFQLFRRLAGFTQKEAAKKLFVSREVLACYETDRAQPSIETLLRMKQVYRQSIDRLLGAPSVYPELEDAADADYLKIVYTISKPSFGYKLAKERVDKYYDRKKITEKIDAVYGTKTKK